MWWNKQKEQNMNWTCTSTTILPIPTAKEAKTLSDRAKKQRIATAEQSIFNNACSAINQTLKEGYCSVNIDPRNIVYKVDRSLDNYSIEEAAKACARHLETYGYSATFISMYSMIIRWDDPKELNFDELWAIAKEGL